MTMHVVLPVKQFYFQMVSIFVVIIPVNHYHIAVIQSESLHKKVKQFTLPTSKLWSSKVAYIAARLIKYLRVFNE